MRISKGAPRFYVTARNKHELRCVQRSQHCCSVAELACWFLVFTAPIAKAERHFPGGAPSLSRAPSTARMALDATVICNRQRHKETYPVSRPDCASLHQPYGTCISHTPYASVLPVHINALAASKCCDTDACIYALMPESEVLISPHSPCQMVPQKCQKRARHDIIPLQIGRGAPLAGAPSSRLHEGSLQPAKLRSAHRSVQFYILANCILHHTGPHACWRC